jgi:hypothetical protein
VSMAAPKDMKIVLLITVLESLVITAWLMLRRFRRDYSGKPAAMMIPVVNNAVGLSKISSSLDASHWSFINGWKVADQADDRRLAPGMVAQRAGSAAAQRSFARSSHQRGFKAWSQERHD